MRAGIELESMEQLLMTNKRRILINEQEVTSHQALESACGKYGARVFAKPRVSDVVSIQSSGINDMQYSYSLRAHFDFVVTDEESFPLFAVEFDGESHNNDVRTIARDSVKNAICEYFDLPLLRVDEAFLERVGNFVILG